MAIEVELPDGSIAEFPDGTSREIMTAAMQKRFPVQQAAPQEQRSLPQEMVRQLGLTARVGVEGIADIADFVATPIRGGLNWANEALGGTPDYFKPASQVLPQALNLPEPENDLERLVNKAGRGVASTAATMGAGLLMQGTRAVAAAPSMMQGIGATLSASPGTQLLSSASSSALAAHAQNSGASPGVQAAAGLIGGGLPAGAVGLTRSIKSGLGGLVNQDKLSAFRQAGIAPPSLGAVSNSGVVQGIESGLAQAIPSRGVMQRAREAGQQGLTQAVDDAAERLAGGRNYPRSAEEAGMLAHNAAGAGKQKFQDIAGRFENRVYEPIGQSPARLDNTLSKIHADSQKLSPHAGAAYNNSMVNQLGDAYADNTIKKLNVSTLRREAQKVGERMKAAPSADTGGAAQFEIKKLYATLKQDITEAIPEGSRESVARYNKWYSTQKDLRKEVENTFFRGDNVATARAILSAEGAQLDKLRKVVGPQGFAQLRASALRQASLGSGVDGAQGLVSSAYLGKALGQGRGALPEGAQRALFGGEADNLRRLTNALNESRLAANTSNTAGALSAAQYLGLGATGMVNPLAAAGAVAAPYGTARFLTSPKQINRLAGWGQTDFAPTRGAMVPVTARSLLDLMDKEEKPAHKRKK